MFLQNQLQHIRAKWHPLWRLRKTRTYRYLQSRFDFVVFIYVDKIKDKIAVKFLRDLSWVLSSSNHEQEIVRTFDLILTILRPRTFWDVGSNVGFYSWFVRQYPSIQSIQLFEPDPTNVELLKKTIARNGILNCEIMNVAVSDRVGDSTFIIDNVSGATGTLESTSTIADKSTLHSHYDLGENTITCRTVSLDSLLDSKVPPEFIKIDVEGAEHLVLSGSNYILNQYNPTMVIETSNYTIIERLANIDYCIFQIDAGNILALHKRHTSALDLISKNIPYFDTKHRSIIK